MPQIRAATDIGGTFTDLVYYELDEKSGTILNLQTQKTHTTPDRFEKGVMDTFAKADVTISDLIFFAHGSTVVINALTERKGVKTALITTKGFRDILEIARGDRPDFFNLQYEKPAPFIPRFLRKEITERLNYKGEIVTALDTEELPQIIDFFKSENVEAIAIALLHSYANPAHEEKLVHRIQKLWPEVSVIASHQVSREWREYERTNTAALCAYIKPVAQNYLSNMETTLGDEGFRAPFYVMQSNGGIDTVKAVKETPITMVESGPASGVLGAAALGKILGIANIIAFDIGGTTAKCSLIDDGRVKLTNKYMIEKSGLIAGYPIMTPVVDIVEIGNGGGSIGWVDDFSKLHVGPQSAGAKPGPVAYGLGGKAPTTTDANLMLGRINPNYFIGGEIKADMQAVEGSLASLGQTLGLSAAQTARGMVRIANHNMGNALKLISINRGYDPRDFTLVAFGGGGSMHAAALAQELNIPKVIVPANAAVFSAWGMLMSDLRRDYIQTKPTPLNEHASAVIADTFEKMRSEAYQAYASEGIAKNTIYFEHYLEMRYEGQDHSVQLLVDDCDFSKIETLKETFNLNYEQKYTYRLNSNVELVTYKLTAFAKIGRPPLNEISRDGTLAQARKDRRRVDFDQDGVLETDIYQRDRLAAGLRLDGPAIIEETGSTTVIHPGQSVEVDVYGNLHIDFAGAGT